MSLLPFIRILQKAIKYHIFRDLKDKILLFISQLCDVNMTEKFTAKKSYIYKQEKAVVEGNICRGHINLDG